jgi:hypothetical protein
MRSLQDGDWCSRAQRLMHVNKVRGVDTFRRRQRGRSTSRNLHGLINRRGRHCGGTTVLFGDGSKTNEADVYQHAQPISNADTMVKNTSRTTKHGFVVSIVHVVCQKRTARRVWDLSGSGGPERVLSLDPCAECIHHIRVILCCGRGSGGLDGGTRCAEEGAATIAIEEAAIGVGCRKRSGIRGPNVLLGRACYERCLRTARDLGVARAWRDSGGTVGVMRQGAPIGAVGGSVTLSAMT